MIKIIVEIEHVTRPDGDRDLQMTVQCFPKVWEPHITDVESACAEGMRDHILNYIREKGTAIVAAGGAAMLWEKETETTQQEGTNERQRDTGEERG